MASLFELDFGEDYVGKKLRLFLSNSGSESKENGGGNSSLPVLWEFCSATKWASDGSRACWNTFAELAKSVLAAWPLLVGNIFEVLNLDGCPGLDVEHLKGSSSKKRKKKKDVTEPNVLLRILLFLGVFSCLLETKGQRKLQRSTKRTRTLRFCFLRRCAITASQMVNPHSRGPYD